MRARGAMLGRKRERAELLAALREGRCVALTGPAGIGKTTLAEAVAADLAAGGIRVLAVQATAALRDIPLGALAPLLPAGPGHAPGQAGASPASARPDTARPDSARPDSTGPVGAEPASASPIGTEPDSTGPDSTGPASTNPIGTEPDSTGPGGAGPRAGMTAAPPFGDGGALAAAREAILGPGGAPLALVVDDAHLLDGVSAALVQQVVSAGRAAALLLARSPAGLPDPLAALARRPGSVQLTVGPLSAAESAAVAEVELDGQLDGSSAARLHRLADGVPLVLHELIGLAVASGSLTDRRGVWALDGGVPADTGVGHLVSLRLDELGHRQREAAEAVAVAEPVPLATLEQLAGHGPIEDLETIGLLAVSGPDGAEQVRMGHPLYAELLRAALPATRRRRLARALTAAFERTGQGDPVQRELLRLTAGLPGDPGRLLTAGLLAVRHDQPLATRLLRAAVRAGGGAPARMALARLLAAGDADEALALLDEVTESEVGPQAWASVLATRALAMTLGSGRPGDVLAELGDVTGAPPPVRLAAAIAHLLAGTVRQSAALAAGLAAELAAASPGSGPGGTGPPAPAGAGQNPVALMIGLCQTAALATSGELDTAVTIGEAILASVGRTPAGSFTLAPAPPASPAPHSASPASPAMPPATLAPPSAGPAPASPAPASLAPHSAGPPPRPSALAVPTWRADGEPARQVRPAGPTPVLPPAGPSMPGPVISGSAIAGAAIAGPAMSGSAMSATAQPVTGGPLGAPASPPRGPGQAVAGQTVAGQAVAGQAVAGQAVAGQAVAAGQAADPEVAEPWPGELPDQADGDTVPEFWGVAAALLLALEQRGDLDRVGRLGGELLELAVGRADTTGRARMLQCVGRAQLLRGRPAAAARALREVISLLRRVDETFLAWNYGLLAAAQAAAGQQAAAAASLAQMDAATRQFPVYVPEQELCRALVCAAAGDQRGARAAALASAGLATRLGHAPVALAAWHCVARCGEPRRALAGARAAAGQVDGPLASLLRGNVEALAARDHGRLAEVADGLAGLGALPLAAEALGEAARLAGAAGDQLLAAGLAERLHQVLAGCEPRCLPATALPGAVAAPLTSREREIALLAARGSSDRDIAARLGISPRTVQTHLSRAYAKAGVSRRDQLAAIFGLPG